MARWHDRSTEATALGLMRSDAIVHNGWQFALDSEYAANGITTVACPALPNPTARVRRLHTTTSGLFLLSSDTIDGPLSLYRNGADGFGDWTEVLATECGRMNQGFDGLVDCGSGRLVVIEYATDQEDQNDNTSRLWMSLDGGDNWSLLFTTAAGSIRHFHSGIYDPIYGTLYIYTGDTSLASSILKCNNVADLAANPNTWKTRWGLDDSTRSTLNPLYVVGYNDQKFRVVTGAFAGDYFYWGADSNINGGVPVLRFHRQTHTVEQIFIGDHSTEPSAAALGSGNMCGECWGAGIAASGHVLLCGYGRTAGHPYYGDGKRHIYAIDPGVGLTGVEIISETGDPALISHIHTVNGITILSDYSNLLNSLAGDVESPSTGSFLPRRSVNDPRLLLTKRGKVKVQVYLDAAARDAAIPNPRSGMVVYNRTYAALQTYNGTFWRTEGRSIFEDYAPAMMLDARRIDDLADGAAVASWVSVEGNARAFVQATEGNQPLYRARAINGLPAVEFDGTNDYLSFDASVLFTGSAGLVLWAGRIHDATGDDVVLSQALSTSASRFTCFNASIVDTERPGISQRNGDTEDINTLPPVTINEKVVIGVRSDGTSYTIWKNNAAGAITVGNGANNGDWFADTPLANRVAIGCNYGSTPGEFFNGMLGFLAVYDSGTVPDDVVKELQAELVRDWVNA